MKHRLRNVFTTGEVARICLVAPRTVGKWFDSGRLRGYRIPGSQDRRIPRQYLIEFLMANGMEHVLDNFESVLIVLPEAAGEPDAQSLLAALGLSDRGQPRIAHGTFQAGGMFARFHPNAVILVGDYPATVINSVLLCAEKADVEFRMIAGN